MSPSRVSATRVAAAKATTMSTAPAPSAGQRTLLGAGDQVCPQPAHAPEPPVVVLCLAAEVFRDLRVRKDQESLVSDALDHDVGHLLRLEGAGGQEVGAEGIRNERFLILPHPEVAEYFSRKAQDYDRWLRGMRRLRANLITGSK